MPRKALVAVGGLLVAASLLGCSSGSDGHSSDSAGGQEPTASSGPASIGGLQKRTRAIRARRRRNHLATRGDGTGTAPVVGHHDSGGGSAQFRGPGDNSIQDYGHEAPATERERAAAILHGYLDARAAGRWKDACLYISAGAIVMLERVAELSQGGSGSADCQTILSALGRGADRKALARAADIDVGSLRVRGERSFILYHGAEGRGYAIPMTREGDEWKVAGIEGTPLL